MENFIVETERSIHYKSLNDKNMNSRINWTSIKSAISFGLVTGLLAMGGYILKLGDVFAIDVHAIVNVFALAFLGVVVSIIQSLLTGPTTGRFLGILKVK